MIAGENLSLIVLRIRAWLPAGFVVVGVPANDELPVAESELAIVKGAVLCRRQEFVAGRWCAREALREVGCSDSALLPGPLGSPVWPPGYLGSITHDDGHCIAVAGWGGTLRGIGVDLCAARRRAHLPDLAPLLL